MAWKGNKICVDGGKGKWACGAQVTEGTEAAVGSCSVEEESVHVEEFEDVRPPQQMLWQAAESHGSAEQEVPLGSGMSYAKLY